MNQIASLRAISLVLSGSVITVLAGLLIGACASGEGDPPTEDELCAVCDAVAECRVDAGVAACICPDGYQDPIGNGSQCTDIDECATNNDDCGDRAECENLLGSYTCTCLPGYTGDGTNCADIDECAEPDTCDPNASCMNYDGSFSCTCADGYQGDGATCEDVDECLTGIHECDENALCGNLDGTYECTCEDGFTGDGFVCTDLDECLLGIDECVGLTVCANLPGAYECVCPPGYFDEFGDSTSCLLGAVGRVHLIGHDYFVNNPDNNRMLGNAIFSANTTGNVEILGFTGFADNAPGQEVGSVNSAINARAAELGRSYTLATFTDYTELNNLLFGKHVLLIYEQESASAATMVNIGFSWAPTLAAFVDGGGVVVVTDYDGTTWRLLDRTGLMDITSTTTLLSGTTLYTREPGHALMDGLASNYAATTGTRYFNVADAVPVVSDGNNQVVVWTRSQNSECVIVDDFESGVWPNERWTSVDGSAGQPSLGAAHDFAWGLENPDWSYHIDTNAGGFGERVRVWFRVNAVFAKLNLGFGSTAAGTHSLSLDRFLSYLSIQNNPGYDLIYELEGTSFSPEYNKWYQFEVQFGGGGLVTARVYEELNASPLVTLNVTINDLQLGGIALHGQGGVQFDSPEICPAP